MSIDIPLESPLESHIDNSLSDVHVLTLTELACMAGASRQIIEELIDIELIEPCVLEPELAFDVEILPRVRKIIRLHLQLDVSISSLALVLDLMDRIDYLEKRIAELESKK